MDIQVPNSEIIEALLDEIKALMYQITILKISLQNITTNPTKRFCPNWPSELAA